MGGVLNGAARCWVYGEGSGFAENIERWGEAYGIVNYPLHRD